MASLSAALFTPCGFGRSSSADAAGPKVSACRRVARYSNLRRARGAKHGRRHRALSTDRGFFSSPQGTES